MVAAMAVSNTARLGLPQASAPSDPFPGRSGFNAIWANLDSKVAIDVQVPDQASLPAAGVRGRYGWVVDKGRLFRDTGSEWLEVATLRSLNDGTPGSPQNGTLTPASGWQDVTANWVRFGPMVDLLIVATRIGADMAVNAAGNLIPDVTIGTALTSSVRPTSPVYAQIERPATQRADAVVNPDGSVQIIGGGPGVTYGQGQYRLRVTYAVAL